MCEMYIFRESSLLQRSLEKSSGSQPTYRVAGAMLPVTSVVQNRVERNLIEPPVDLDTDGAKRAC